MMRDIFDFVSACWNRTEFNRGKQVSSLFRFAFSTDEATKKNIKRSIDPDSTIIDIDIDSNKTKRNKKMCNIVKWRRLLDFPQHFFGLPLSFHCRQLIACRAVQLGVDEFCNSSLLFMPNSFVAICDFFFLSYFDILLK